MAMSGYKLLYFYSTSHVSRLKLRLLPFVPISIRVYLFLQFLPSLFIDYNKELMVSPRLILDSYNVKLFFYSNLT